MPLLTLWSPKGGSGTSVFAAACALVLARGPGARLVDLGGDQPAIFGLGAEPGTGVADWLEAGPGAPSDALDRLAIEAAPGVALIPAGDPPAALSPRPEAEAGAALAVALRDGPVPTLVDAGTAEAPAARALLEVSDVTLVVVRGCYLTLRRSVRHPALGRASGLIVVEEPGRAIGAREIADVLGPPGHRPGAGPGGGGPRGRRRRPRASSARRAGPPRDGSPASGRAPARPAGCGGVSRSARHAARRRWCPAAPRAPTARRLGGGRVVGRGVGAGPAPASRHAAPRSRSVARHRTGTPGSSASSPTRSPGSGRWSRCSRIASITEVMVNGTGGCFIERGGRLECRGTRPRRSRDPAHRRADPRPTRVAARPFVADGRRPPPGRFPAPRGDPTARARRSVRHDPTVRCAGDRVGGVRCRRRRDRVPPVGRGRRLELPRLGWHQLGEDHAAQRAVRRDRSRRAGHHDRRDGRAAVGAAACRAARSPPGQCRRRRRGVGTGSRAHRVADAAGSDRGRRGAGRGGARSAPGLEHRSRRCALDGPRQRSGRRAAPHRDAGAVQRCGAAVRLGVRAGLRRGRRRGAGGARAER